jgi:hypothetical protein
MLIKLPIHNLKLISVYGRQTGLKLVMTSQDQDWFKDRKRLCLWSFAVQQIFFSSNIQADQSRYRSKPLGSKNWTGPDFQALTLLQKKNHQPSASGLQYGHMCQASFCTQSGLGLPIKLFF